MDDLTRARLRGIAEEYLAGAGGCHHVDHTIRVVLNARRLAECEPAADGDRLEAAAWLHDIGRALEEAEGVSHAVISARLAAERLPELGFAVDTVEHICRAIADHRFSAGVVPESLEGKLLQDADRLDALGAVGIARTFAHGWDRALYHADDPFAEHRALDDAQYALDHFFTKLLKLPDTLHTPAARTLAEERVAFLRAFLDQLAREISLA